MEEDIIFYPGEKRAECAEKSSVSAPGDPAALRGIEELYIPGCVREMRGLNRFPDLRAVRYDGVDDVFGFGESIAWLGEKTGDAAGFLNRVATNLLAFRPLAEPLAAVTAPKAPPIQALPGWRELMTALEELLAQMDSLGFYRQDYSRENAVICSGYTQLKRLEWAFYMGYAAFGDEFSPEIAGLYDKKDRLSPEDRGTFLLALSQGHSYREIYSSFGGQACRRMGSREGYMEYLRPLVVWKDNEKFHCRLRRLLDMGLLRGESADAALAEFTSRHMTEATAILLDRTRGQNARDDDLSL